MKKLGIKDKKILEALHQNGRAQIKEVAKKTGIPKDSVKYRIQRMEREGVLKFFAPVLDTTAMGYPIYTFVNIIIKSYSLEEERRFLAFAQSHPNIVYGVKLTGKYHYFLAIAAKDLSHFDSILKGVLDKFSGMIKEYDASSIIKEFKYDTFHDLIDAP